MADDKSNVGKGFVAVGIGGFFVGLAISGHKIPLDFFKKLSMIMDKECVRQDCNPT